MVFCLFAKRPITGGQVIVGVRVVWIRFQSLLKLIDRYRKLTLLKRLTTDGVKAIGLQLASALADDCAADNSQINGGDDSTSIHDVSQVSIVNRFSKNPKQTPIGSENSRDVNEIM